MSNEWWFILLIEFQIFWIVICRLSYKFGIWDGARMPWTPRVQKVLRHYDDLIKAKLEQGR